MQRTGCGGSTRCIMHQVHTSNMINVDAAIVGEWTWIFLRGFHTMFSMMFHKLQMCLFSHDVP
jgi:hypothetical protein